MPQIAQQDYKIIAPTPGRVFTKDAAALAELKKAILNGIAFDCLLENVAVPDEGGLNRVLGVYENGSVADAWSVENEEFVGISLTYTVSQYQGLAAVQAEIDRIEGVIMDEFPNFDADNNLLVDANNGYKICTPEGYQYKVTITNGKIATIEVSTTKIQDGDDFIAISIEDAQKLIGLPCD